MRIVKLQATKLDASTIIAFLNSPACAGWPELQSIKANPVYLNAIAVLFQVFANKSENIAPFFNQLSSFLKNYDATPNNQMQGRVQQKTTAPYNSPAQTK